MQRKGGGSQAQLRLDRVGRMGRVGKVRKFFKKEKPFIVDFVQINECVCVSRSRLRRTLFLDKESAACSVGAVAAMYLQRDSALRREKLSAASRYNQFEFLLLFNLWEIL